MPPKRPREDSITSSRASGDADADTHTGVDASDSESVSEYQDVKPNLAKASKTTKSSASKATKVKVEKKASKPKPKAIKTPKTSTSASSDAGGKKMGPWAADELKELYTVMCPKRTGVKWDDVAAAIPGRDAKSCNNKWSRMQNKIMEAVMGMGD
ncbi:uncharacterized protein EHS24_009232 [Apiotrichum porosum]|uniref:Myb-like domain-containing protein n=1 Tax=Apiotrichum porosum TaxID=105984 RepID=A0A427XP91_9TREE|nr:uncharacterized protein EHS24_009232 [Apiotrichum porosum]RSH80648.1 hypothetical protein EHS24_009232 [Apiotrichum porosum]